MRRAIDPIRIATIVFAAASLFVLGGPALASASAVETPPKLWESCPPGTNAGQCTNPRGVAVSPVTGNVYLFDLSTHRINEFTPWGVFVKAWGWGVTDGSPELQSCGPGASPPTTDCQVGLKGAGAGEFSSEPRGLAVDSGGDVYIYEGGNHRVQKFDAQGNFILMFGGEVNKGGGAPSNPGDICTATDISNGDQCGPGSIGANNGQFGKGSFGSFGFRAGGNAIAIDPTSPDAIYVGDDNRIQRFSTQGNYAGQIPLPEPGVVNALALDPQSEDLYFAYASDTIRSPLDVKEAAQPNVYRLDTGSGEVVGKPLEARLPEAIAVDSAGRVFVYDAESNNGNGGSTVPPNHPARILEFSSAGSQPTILFENDPYLFAEGSPVLGLVSSTACGISGSELIAAGIEVSNQHPLFAAYGPPPDPSICLPPAVPPTFNATYALAAGTNSATVRAAINPHFWSDTKYYVEFGTGKCSEEGCDQRRPLGQASRLTSQVLDASVNTAGVLLPDLTPGTTYHFRFVAESGGGGPVLGPERVFRTFAVPVAPPGSPCPNSTLRGGLSARLPDCRAYEMVSPVDKNNGDVSMPGSAQASFDQASSDGERMTFSSFRSFPGTPASPLSSQYLATRIPGSGWATQAITPPREDISYYPLGGGEGIQYKAFSDDLCSGWMLQDTGTALASGAPSEVPNLYRRENCSGGAYELLTSVAPPEFTREENHYNSRFYPEIQGFSADGSRSVFRAPAKLTPNANPKKGLYQVYEAHEGLLRLISVLPNGSAATTHSSAGTLQPGGLEGNFRSNSVQTAVSDDGSRVFWSAGASSDGKANPYSAETGKLYLRVNSLEPQSKISSEKCTEASRACTLLISGNLETEFWAADPEGERAFYSVGAPTKSELFQYHTATQSSQLLAKEVTGVLGASKDAETIYFASREVLSENQNSNGDSAINGSPNLYKYGPEDEGNDYTFIGTLADDFVDSRDYERDASERTSRVSPDGSAVAFLSRRPLTDYDNVDVNGGEPAREVFLYRDGILRCASCNPGGARPHGRNVTLDSVNTSWTAASLPGWQAQNHPGNALSTDGSRLYFNSFDALTPDDTNGKKDVYEWEAPESGDCTKAEAAFSVQDGGCVSLISSGESPDDSEFFDATPSGSDVFFATQSSLLPQDSGLVDVYDARVDGGFPQTPPPAPACEGEACQGQLSQPNDLTPGSSTYQGPGNPAIEKKKAVKHRRTKKHKQKKHGAKKSDRNGGKRRTGR